MGVTKIPIIYFSYRKRYAKFIITRMKDNSIKDWIIFGSGILTLIAGIVLAFIGIYIPPQGILDGSVLTVIAEFLTFAGSCMGIVSYTALQIHRINKSVNKDEDK